MKPPPDLVDRWLQIDEHRATRHDELSSPRVSEALQLQRARFVELPVGLDPQQRHARSEGHAHHRVQKFADNPLVLGVGHGSSGYVGKLLRGGIEDEHLHAAEDAVP